MNYNEFHDYYRMSNEHSYAAMLGYLSLVAHKAYTFRMISEEPFQALLVVDETMMSPIKGQPESSVDRIRYLATQMLNIEFDLWIAVVEDTVPTMKHPVSCFWPVRRSASEEPNYYTVHLPHGLKGKENEVRKISLDSKKHVTVDYNLPVEKAIQKLSRAQYHMCYQGGTAWLSVALGTPTYIVHNVSKLPKTQHHLKQRLYGQELGRITAYDPVHGINTKRQISFENHITVKEAQAIIDGHS